jgi:integrase
VTTLCVYLARRAEADQRAVATLSTWLPARPDAPVDSVERAKADPKSPYEVLAAKVRREIFAGSIERGGQLPTVKQLAESNGVSLGTVHRAFSLLAQWGLIEVSRGRRATVMRKLGPPSVFHQG